VGSFVLLVLVISTIINVQSYRNNYKHYISDIRNQVERIAAGAALFVDGEMHATFTEPSAMKSEAFVTTRNQLMDYLQATGMTYIYTLSQVDSDTTQFIIDASEEEPAELGYEYEYMEGMEKAFNGEPSSDDDVYTDEWGTFISGYAPVKDDQGNVVAIVGVDIEASELETRKEAFLLQAIIQSIIALVIAVILGGFLAHRIAQPIGQLRNKLRALSANGGDLRQRIEINTKDELEELSESVNVFIFNVGEIVKSIILFAEKVSSSSHDFDISVDENRKAIEEVASSVSSIAGGATDQAMLILDVSKNMEDITASINENEQMIHSINTYANESKKHLNNGMKAIENQGEKTQENIQAFRKVFDVVNHLAKEASEVESIVATISNISNQTNLLALNAAIEAARAGEHGRGFSIVADEVRKLAEESNQSAIEIGEIIQRISKDTQDVLSEIKLADQSTSEQKMAVDETNKTYKTMIEEMNSMIDGVHQINQSFTAIVEKTHDTNKKTKNISEVAQDNAAIAQELSATTEEESAVMDGIANNSRILHELSLELKMTVSKFKV
jgi:methyl-accepting chemotaxis protein